MCCAPQIGSLKNKPSDQWSPLVSLKPTGLISAINTGRVYDAFGYRVHPNTPKVGLAPSGDRQAIVLNARVAFGGKRYYDPLTSSWIRRGFAMEFASPYAYPTQGEGFLAP